jgi:hypothetical protein
LGNQAAFFFSGFSQQRGIALHHPATHPLRQVCLEDRWIFGQLREDALCASARA